MIISIASGKGGTGKTTVSTNIALLLDNVKFIDTDVEEPNAHIFLRPEFDDTYNVVRLYPEVDYNKCTFCGECAKACAFNAIAVANNKVLVFKELCHGCGLCSYVCPERAITEEGRTMGIIRHGKALSGIEFWDGLLNLGEATPVPVIKDLKEKALKDYDERKDMVIIDAPPGTSCPVIEAIRGSDYAILVTEPTPYGLADLKLMIEVAKDFGIPYGIVINKANLGDKEIYSYLEKENVELIAEIPFDREGARLYSQGIPLYNVKIFEKPFKNIVDRLRGMKKSL